MAVYYNEIDPDAAEWLRNLIAEGVIASGVVDERSIEDVLPGELVGYTQCHFFAGIGVWSYALRRAGWPDDLPIWTGSCPCQPFSGTGKGKGFADERHLWPAFHHLISICRPQCIVGEQVASKRVFPWLDLVQDDLEAEDYAFAAKDLCVAGIGGPHIRQRLFWMANQMRGGGTLRLGDAIRTRLEGYGGDGDGARRWPQSIGSTAETGNSGDRISGPANGFWRDADWLRCRDGKWRPVESGTSALVDGSPTRLGSDGALETQPRKITLKGYGNAINAEVATIFIRSTMEVLAA